MSAQQRNWKASVLIWQFLQALAVVGFPIFFIGWETFGWGYEITNLHYRGPLNNRLIRFSDFSDKEWNGDLIVLYYLKYRIFRISQFFLIIAILVYLFFAYQSAVYALSVGEPIAKLLLEPASIVPQELIRLMEMAAACWAIGIFVKISTAHVGVVIKKVAGEIGKVKQAESRSG